MASSTSDKLQTTAYFFLAGGFLLSAASAIAKMNESKSLAGLGRAPRLPSDKKLKLVQGAKTKNYDVKDIDERAGLIADLIRTGSKDSDFREAVVKMLSQKCDSRGMVNANGDRWCVPEKNCLAEVKAIFSAIREPRSEFAIRYIRDNLIADVFTEAKRTLLLTHGGDCDDYTIVCGAALLATGHPVKMRIVAVRRDGIPDDQAPWSHIYLLTPMKFDDPNTEWVSMGRITRLQAAKPGKNGQNTTWTALDASMDRPLGWEAPGAKDVAATGKPAGIIARVRDYNVVRPGDEA